LAADQLQYARIMKSSVLYRRGSGSAKISALSPISLRTTTFTAPRTRRAVKVSSPLTPLVIKRCARGAGRCASPRTHPRDIVAVDDARRSWHVPSHPTHGA
jgi:hypothetical protein